MKAIVSNDLKNRVICAAANGSVIAKDLLEAIRNCRDIKQETDKCINYFDSKRKVANFGDRKTIRIVVTCCRKDVTNRNFPDYGNPQAPYFPENRNEISVSDFSGVFKAVRDKEDGGYDETDWTFFDSAMRLASVVKFRIGATMSDFIKAYDATNYIGISQDDNSPLHGSCMRGEETARNAADYYVNFAGAKILIAETQDGEVCARAILWDNIHAIGSDTPINFIDRTYTAFDGFLMKRMREEALKAGYVWRKTHNDYCHKRKFTPMADSELVRHGTGEVMVFHTGESYSFTVTKPVPAHKLHKKGCPYCDTMSYLFYKQDGCQMTICNNNDVAGIGDVCADLAMTGGYGSRKGNICPVCGKHHTNGTDLCSSCNSDFYADTLFGRVVKGKATTYNGAVVPASVMKAGKPTAAFAAYIALQRICVSYFNL